MDYTEKQFELEKKSEKVAIEFAIWCRLNCYFYKPKKNIWLDVFDEKISEEDLYLKFLKRHI